MGKTQHTGRPEEGSLMRQADSGRRGHVKKLVETDHHHVGPQRPQESFPLYVLRTTLGNYCLVLSTKRHSSWTPDEHQGVPSQCSSILNMHRSLGELITECRFCSKRSEGLFSHKLPGDGDGASSGPETHCEVLPEGTGLL